MGDILFPELLGQTVSSYHGRARGSELDHAGLG